MSDAAQRGRYASPRRSRSRREPCAAVICRDKQGNPEPDPELRDTESVPLAESIDAFVEREVRPHVPDAWIDTRHTPPRPLEEIQADIRGIEQDILRMLA